MDVQHKAVMEIAFDYCDFISFMLEQGYYTVEEVSYKKWAIQEIIFRMEETPNVPPLDIIDDFESQMLMFYNKKHCDVFYAAYEAAENLTDHLMSM